MLIFVELLRNVSRHGDVECARIIIPSQFYAAVLITRSILYELIFFSDAFNEVVGVFLSNIFHAEVVDNQGEGDGAPFVTP